MTRVAWLIMGEKSAGPLALSDFFATRNVAAPISERPSLPLQSSLRSVALLGREGLSLWEGNLAG